MQAADTSRQALKGMSLRKRKTLADEVETAIAHIQRTSGDASMGEVQDYLERHLGRRVDLSNISARVKELEAAKRVVRDRSMTRLCKFSKASIHPLTVAPEQQRMFA